MKFFRNGKLHSVYLLFFFSVLIWGCSSYKWKQGFISSELPLVFDRTYLAGSGIKATSSGYYIKPCMTDVEKAVSGGELDVKFHRVSDAYSSGKPRLDFFVKKSLNRASQFNLSGKKNVSFLLSVSIKNRISGIIEDSVKLRKDIKEKLKKGDISSFFDSCGTRFVHSVKYNSSLYLFVSYYPSDEKEVKKFERIIKRRISSLPEDMMQIKLFDMLNFRPDTYFSMTADTGIIFEPVEFTFYSIHGKKLDAFLEKAFISLSNSGTGEFAEFTLRPWKSLVAVRDLIKPVKKNDILDFSDESVYRSISFMENSVKQFRLKYAQAKRAMECDLEPEKRKAVKDCALLLEKMNSRINWQTFSVCSDQALKNRTVDLENLESCGYLTESIKELNRGMICKCLTCPEIPDKEILSSNIFIPVELVDIFRYDHPSVYGRDTDYRFNDKDQIENIPPSIKPGQNTDRFGKTGYDECIIKKTMHFSELGKDRTSHVTTDSHPYRKIKWPLWKRIFLFWKDPPSGKKIFRGSFEIEGFSGKLMPDFEITKDAMKLAKKSFTQFCRKYGTHYVSQINHRRGFVYYFSDNSSEIKIRTYGMPDPEILKKLHFKEIKRIPESGGPGGCLFSMSWMPGVDAYSPPELEPENKKQFFKTKGKIIRLFENDSNAVPVRVSLEPWTEYLVNRGIIAKDQLDFLEMSR